MKSKACAIATGAAVAITIASLLLWQATGGDYYTKFERIEQVESPVDPDDPLAGTGFYEGTSHEETIITGGLRFGLLPTPGSIADKHLLSVATVTAPPWIIVLALALIVRRRRRVVPP